MKNNLIVLLLLLCLTAKAQTDTPAYSYEIDTPSVPYKVMIDSILAPLHQTNPNFVKLFTRSI